MPPAWGGKTLYEVLTVAGAVPLLMTDPRVDGNLASTVSVRPSLQLGGGHTRSRLPRRDCHVTRVTLIENFASNAAVQKLVDVKPDRTSPEIL